ncbi:MAG: hypothetical protein LCH61_12210 [Proteobacteria bacterium]|nr:hypothetical protein [Pseudomonadota bacterium]
MYKSGIIIGAALAVSVIMLEPARAGGFGVGVGVGVEVDAGYSPWRSNHPYAWQYPSTYPYSIPVTYNAGPGAYYPAKRYRRKAARGNYRWTGYPPRHFYVTNYNGYAPQYGFHPYNDHYRYYR